VSNKDKVLMWTDGSGTSASTPGGWAYLSYVLEYRTPDGRVTRRECFGGALQMSNNQAELAGPLHGLRALKHSCEVLIRSDSQYVVNAFRQDRINLWQRWNWHKVTFEWVRRASDRNNERCDALAGQARREIVAALAKGDVSGLSFELDDPDHLP
jgi:ribonuclease HI